MERTMKKLLSLSIISLLFISFQSFAGRPAEDDSTLDMAPALEEPNSNIPAPETTMQDTVSEETDTEMTTTNVQQTGDVIQIQEMPVKSQIVVIDFPVRGMDMTKVLNELGEPNTRFPAIGQPPITRWVYSDRTVFFEYSHVIHVVAR